MSEFLSWISGGVLSKSINVVGMFSNNFFGYLRLTPRNQSHSAPEFKAHYLETTSISDLDFSKAAARASIVPRALDFCSTPSVGPCHLEISGNMGYWCQPLCCKLVYLCEFMGNILDITKNGRCDEQNRSDSL